jgi:carbamate kinase
LATNARTWDGNVVDSGKDVHIGYTVEEDLTEEEMKEITKDLRFTNNKQGTTDQMDPNAPKSRMTIGPVFAEGTKPQKVMGTWKGNIKKDDGDMLVGVQF